MQWYTCKKYILAVDWGWMPESCTVLPLLLRFETSGILNRTLTKLNTLYRFIFQVFWRSVLLVDRNIIQSFNKCLYYARVWHWEVFLEQHNFADFKEYSMETRQWIELRVRYPIERFFIKLIASPPKHKPPKTPKEIIIIVIPTYEIGHFKLQSCYNGQDITYCLSLPSTLSKWNIALVYDEETALCKHSFTLMHGTVCRALTSPLSIKCLRPPLN